MHDAGGGSVAEARVVVTDIGTNARRESVSAEDGRFQVVGLPPAAYKVAVERDGFKTAITSPLTLEIGQSLGLDFVLELGAVHETLRVTDEASRVETASPSIGATITGAGIQGLPLNGRDSLQLALTQAGVTPAAQNLFAATGVRTGTMQMAGAHDNAVSYLLDGGDNTSFVFGVPVADPNPDAVEEFRILLGSYTAEYGRSAGGVVSVITRSGTNAAHGSAFDYLRNNTLDANNFFNQLAGRPRPVLRRNQFGASLGGPVVIPRLFRGQNRLFFFYNFQGQRQAQDILNPQVTAFTPLELKGDFSSDRGVAAFLTANPYFQPDPVLASRAIIDPARIDHVAQSYIAAGLIPVSADGVVTPLGRATDDRSEHLGKLDFNPSQRQRWSATLSAAANPQLYPFLSPGLGPDVSGFPGRNQFHAYFGNLSNTYVRSPSELNELHLVAQRSRVQLNYPARQLPGPAELGFVDAAGEPSILPDLVKAPPQLIFANSNMQLGFNLFGPVDSSETTYNLSDMFTRVGRHTWKVGGAISVLQNNIQSGYLVDGQFTFAGTATGSDLADFLLGQPTAFGQGERGVNAIRQRRYAAFFQDDWRVHPRLHLSLGLRYEYATPKSDPQGRIEMLMPGLQSKRYRLAPLGLLFSGDPGAPAGATFPDRTNWAPRIGFGWDPAGDGRTSLRGGAGVFFDQSLAQDNEYETGGPPFSRVGAALCLAPCRQAQGAAASLPYLADPYGSSGSPNPFAMPFPSPQNLNFAAEGFLPFGYSSGFIDPRQRTPYVYQYSLSLQRQWTGGLMTELAYSGSSSHKLLAWIDGDPILRGTGTYLLNMQPGLQIPDAYGPAPFVSTNAGTASYNGLLATLRHKLPEWSVFKGGFVTLGYAWSHEIDDADGLFRNSQQVSYYSHHQFRASGAGDFRQRLVVSGEWDVRAPSRLQAGWRRLADGWQLYAILTLQSGPPVDVNAGLPVLGEGIPGPSGAGDQNLVRPDLVRPAHPLDPSRARTLTVDGRSITGQFFFDPNSVAIPDCFASYGIPGSATPGACPAPTYGTLGRNAFRGPGRFNLDVALERRAKLGNTGAIVSFRAEFYNVLNQTQWQIPVGPVAVDSPLLGQITSAFDPRIGQVSLRVQF